MYMPPEIFTSNLKNAGPPIDVWAIGIIIYALVTGYLPFNG
jgi:serine/threonine protein kinase